MANDRNRRLHPKLRLVANGSEIVNAHRAQSSNCVASTVAAPTKMQAPTSAFALESLKQFGAGTLSGQDLPPVRPERERPKLAAAGVANQAFVNVFIETNQTDPGGTNPAIGIVKAIEEILTAHKAGSGISQKVLARRNFVAATVPVSALSTIATFPGVTFVHSAESLALRLPQANRTDTAAAPSARDVVVDKARQTGKGVLIGIIDVGGFDFAHEDFIDDQGKTRFHAIWDQGGNFRKHPDDFDYGSELTAERLNAAIAAQDKTGLPAVEIERQSQREISSHGTHVASIAAGRSGVCPDALIAGVLVSLPLPEADRERRQWTFSDASRIIHALEYLYGLAKKLDMPVSINISLGTNGGSHDGANGPCRWIDSSLSVPGRAISIAAGNAGQEAAAGPGDLGWVMGRIHTSGRVQATGLDLDLEWVVVGDGYADFSENELEIWYGPQDRLTVSVQPPDSAEWFTVKPRQFIENKPLSNGTVLSIYNELFHPTNGDNYIAIYLSPNYAPDTPAPVAPGVWKVRLHGDEIRDGRFHAWIERDDPMELERLENLRPYRFPSFFSQSSNVDSHSIGSLGCAHRVVAAANVDTQSGRINISSSQGPTRDGRSKPDIAAPGTDIVAASGFDPESRWVSMTGTSMASPYVCGVIGLMLAAKPGLNAAQCQAILKRTAKPLPSHGYEWRNDAGFGVIDAVAAIAEVTLFDERIELRP